MNTTKHRQFKDLQRLSLRLSTLLKEMRAEHRAEAQQLAQRINALICRLKSAYSKKQLRNALGGLAFLFGMAATPQAHAQSFASPQTNPFGLAATQYLAVPTLVDIDNDGDLDLFVAEYYGNVQYFQNTGSATTPQFAAPVQNPFGITAGYYFSFLAFGDLDGDGDMDLLMGEYYGDINYFENTGTATNPQFATPVTNPFGFTSGYGLAIPTLADVDNDGDLDLLVGDIDYVNLPYSNYPSLRFFQNNGSTTNPVFQEVTTNNPFNGISGYSFAAPHLVDLDDDGDFDLLIGEYYGVIKYHENTGTAAQPAFSTTAQVNPFGLQPGYVLSMITSGDLDNDGDVDVLIGEYYGIMKYYRNTSINIGIDEAPTVTVGVFPNPANNHIQVNTGYHIPKSAEIFDVNGKLLQRETYLHEGISVAGLPAGVYIIKITMESGDVGTTRFTKH